MRPLLVSIATPGSSRHGVTIFNSIALIHPAHGRNAGCARCKAASSTRSAPRVAGVQRAATVESRCRSAWRRQRVALSITRVGSTGDRWPSGPTGPITGSSLRVARGANHGDATQRVGNSSWCAGFESSGPPHRRLLSFLFSRPLKAGRRSSSQSWFARESCESTCSSRVDQYDAIENG